jgi:Mg-chelatase subunit ChlD
VLPQEFVFAFRGNQVALVDRIVLNPKPDKGLRADSEPADPKNWPRQIAVAVSNENPFDGFEEVGQFTLKQEPREQAFPVNRRARFLKLRILENFGGDRVALNEVKILEGTAPGYRSILQASEANLVAAANVIPPVNEADIDLEKESNNTPAEANALRLGRRLKGAIEPLGEQDHFTLTIPGTAPSVLTLSIQGRPYIRTSVSLTDQAGKTILQFDPRRATARDAEFSWLVRPGNYLARVTEPPASIVLIWDTSGSMGKESVKNLQVAVEAYLDQVQPTERYNLIRFSGGGREKDPIPVEVLLPEFTSDRARLKAAVTGKFFSRGGTPFYDAVAKGMQLLEGVQGNRAIVVMTDGIDTTSELGQGNDEARYTAFWRLLERNRIRLYTIGLGGDMPVHYPRLGTSGTRFLDHVAMAMTARSFFTSNPEELKAIYDQIAAELRTPSTYYLRPSISPGLGTLSVTATGERLEAVAAPSQIELILDVSGSMKRQIEGRQMMDIAKDVMVQVIKGLPDDARVALRFSGHRIREGRPADCQDTELVFPFGRINKAAMINRVRAVKALGTTPIAYTLRQVAKDFGSAPGEKLVILVTDGKEECGGSPSAVVSEMVAKGIKVRLNIVGFALAEAAVKQEMERVAKITGGKFYDAQNAKALRQAIQQSLAIPYEVRDAAGVRVAGGLTGEAPIQVPEGIYTVTVRAAGKPIVVPNVRVRYQAFTKVALRKEGQQIGVQVIGP